jgi:hypothetical protein
MKRELFNFVLLRDKVKLRKVNQTKITGNSLRQIE